jgi:hypothetical protein
LAAYFIRQGFARLRDDAATRPSRWLTAGMTLVLMVAYPLPAVDYMGQILTRRSDSPSRLVNYLRSNVSRQCLIETPEYELAFLDDDHRIHLMPPYFFVEATPERVVLLNPQLQPYDFDQVGAEMLILGTFGKGVFKQIYAPARVAQNWRRIAQVDYYDIYVRQTRANKPPERATASSRRIKLASPRGGNAGKTAAHPQYH